jgi:hypothetical protein
MQLTPEQRNALLAIVKLKLELWTAGSHVESLLGCDIATQGDALDALCGGLNDSADAEQCTDEVLIAAFELDETED